MPKLFNYLTRKKETFRPLTTGRVGLYTCGPTVYNYAHVGNLRTYIFEDILRRTFESGGFRVRQIMNLTDVDDKTIRDAKKARKTLQEFTDFYAREFFKDIKRLNILPAWKYPRATAHTKEMIGLIQKLLKRGLAYRANDGVYFNISKFKDYGCLSGVSKRELKPGARVSADNYDKTEVNDFALWKFKKPGEPSWPAPFGAGRPGWHIECSAMSMKYLGETFDIHAGAIDLLFPHHENEIAQSEAATGKTFAKFFVEGEHLMVDGKKMSKSLGNFYTLRDIETRGFDSLDFRYFVLGAHYRSSLNFTWQSLEAARTARLGILNSLERLRRGPFSGHLTDENEVLKVVATAEKQFQVAADDDLNTPKALAVLNELLHYANSMTDKKYLTRRAAKMILTVVFEFDRVLGLNLKKREAPKIPVRVTALLERREQLRKAKKWAEADRVRGEVVKRGFTIEDTPAGPILKKLGRS